MENLRGRSQMQDSRRHGEVGHLFTSVTQGEHACGIQGSGSE